MPLDLWNSFPFSNVSLNAAGLLALADLRTIAERTALTGGASWLDALLLCPGIHHQSKASELNKGEYPACAALTTGYVFRVENPATGFYLQRVSRTACLTAIKVESPREPTFQRLKAASSRDPLTTPLLYLAAVTLTTSALMLFIALRDYWGVTVMGILITARSLNIAVVRQRATRGGQWKGQAEPGVKGDLLILLSQDRWVRMRGLVDDLKAVTSGLWLADATFPEQCKTSWATLLVYLGAALATNISKLGSVILVALLLLSVGLLALANNGACTLQMHGKELRVDGERKPYERRRMLADELIEETKRRDWAIGLGMVPPEEGELGKAAVM